MSENQQALKHVVSMEDLTVDQVIKLIIPLFPIFSLKIRQERINRSKLQRLN